MWQQVDRSEAQPARPNGEWKLCTSGKTEEKIDNRFPLARK
jgi:hypothetical protein